MKTIALMLPLLAACGSAKKSDSSSPPPAPEVTRLNITDACIVGCTLTIDGSYSTGTTISTPYDLVVAYAEGATAPAKCDSSSAAGVVIQIKGLKPTTEYSLRGCVFNSSNATYSPGLVVQHTTPAQGS